MSCRLFAHNPRRRSCRLHGLTRTGGVARVRPTDPWRNPSIQVLGEGSDSRSLSEMDTSARSKVGAVRESPIVSTTSSQSYKVAHGGTRTTFVHRAIHVIVTDKWSRQDRWKRSATRIVLVVGPPGAGKTTYVRDHKQPSDLVVDYDAIAEALGSDATHGHDDVIHRPSWLQGMPCSTRCGAVSARHGAPGSSLRIPKPNRSSRSTSVSL